MDGASSSRDVAVAASSLAAERISRMLLAAGADVAWVATSESELQERERERTVDVVACDEDLLASCLSASSSLTLCVLSRTDYTRARTILAAGAAAVVLPGAQASDWAAVLRQIFNATIVLPVPSNNGHRPGAAAPVPSADLSERELDVLRELVQGATNREIARLLWVTESTVKFHVHNILGKLAATNRTEAASRALEQGLASG